MQISHNVTNSAAPLSYTLFVWRACSPAYNETRQHFWQ